MRRYCSKLRKLYIRKLMGTIADLDIKLGLEGTVREVLYEVLRGE